MSSQIILSALEVEVIHKYSTNIYDAAFFPNLLDSVTPFVLFRHSVHIFHVFHVFPKLVFVLAGRYGHQCLWPTLCCAVTVSLRFA